jgi:hypothetical protein
MIVDYTEQKDKEILFKPGKSIKSADAKKVDKKKETTLSS